MGLSAVKQFQQKDKVFERFIRDLAIARDKQPTPQVLDEIASEIDKYRFENQWETMLPSDKEDKQKRDKEDAYQLSKIVNENDNVKKYHRKLAEIE